MSGPSYWKILTRRKALTIDNDDDSGSGGSQGKLGRILNTFDLTALGVGATLGVGVYVLAGHVSKDQAGPSVVLSFLIAAAASFLAGLCYAEFGARVPKSGSAYIYSYVCIGEFMAFIIGWNLILEYIIGSASVSRGLSLYIDTLANDTMKLHFREVAPMEWDFMSSYFDFFGFTVAILLGGLVSLALALTIFYAKQALYDLEPWALTLAGTLLSVMLLVLLLMSVQPRESGEAPFRVPMVPLLPAISIFVNIYLMLMLDVYTWIRFGIWMGIGLALYAFYGFRNSYREVFASESGWTKIKYVR